VRSDVRNYSYSATLGEEGIGREIAEKHAATTKEHMSAMHTSFAHNVCAKKARMEIMLA
jgi:hypothetical protein